MGGTGEERVMKKKPQASAPRRDETKPAKPAPPQPGDRSRSRTDEAVIPVYDGPRKTDKAPALKGKRSGAIKPPYRGVAAAKRGSAKGRATSYPDQVVKPTQRGRSGPTREQYIRLRIRVRDGRLSLLDSHLVDGPLAQTQRFSGTNAYEITLGDRLLHADSLPDLGVQRSFVNPSGPPEQRGHFITERAVFEFTARVPAHEVTKETIGQMTVRLYRLKAEARTDHLAATSLSRQFERQVRPVAELIGLPASVLPDAIEERGGRTPTL
jgi:hypothetical protein